MADGGVHIFIGGDAAEHTDVAEERGDDHALGDDQTEDGGRCGTDSLTDAKLTRALLDGDEHDVAHAYDTRHQCEEADDPQCLADDAHTHVHLHGLREAVPYPHGVLVVGGGVVVGVERGLIAFFKGLVVGFGL